jgi:hypothetical protein
VAKWKPNVEERRMQCPLCLSNVVLSPITNMSIANTGYRDGHEIRQQQVPLVLVFKAAYCPSCLHPLVAMYHQQYKGENHSPQRDGVEKFIEYVYPLKRVTRPLPAEVPAEFRVDFQEAALVLGDSSKASAALSRRLLQRVLREKLGIKKRDLFQEIDEYIATQNPPSDLADQLHAVRHVGKFAAHPIEDVAAAIVDVEPAEAEWLLELVEAVLDRTFVRPARDAARMATLQGKLAAIKKPHTSP